MFQSQPIQNNDFVAIRRQVFAIAGGEYVRKVLLLIENDGAINASFKSHLLATDKHAMVRPDSAT